MFYKKDVFKNFCKIHTKTPVLVSFLIKSRFNKVESTSGHAGSKRLKYHSYWDFRTEPLRMTKTSIITSSFVAFTWKANRFVLAGFLNLFIHDFLFRNTGEFGAKKYFTDHQTANTIQLFVALKWTFSGLFFDWKSRREEQVPRDCLINVVTCIFAYH